MKLARLPHEPAAVLEFFRDGLEALGAVCERTWYDRLQVLVEGRAARLWNEADDLVEREIRFPAPDQAAPRQAEQEVFPGCPLTFHLAEALNAGGLTLQRAVLQTSDKSRAPSPDVAERLWRLQFPGTTHWFMDSNFAAARHFSLVALARCEIQAIDQHWSLHRLAVSLPEGEPDADLAEHLALRAITTDPPGALEWPALDLTRWQAHLQRALEHELGADLSGIRHRQENYLRRELDRIDDYFEHYQQELAGRFERSKSADAKSKLEQRRAATRAEHERRRLDQVHRHEIRVIPHLDALLLFAESAWRVTLRVSRHGDGRRQEALWVPRTRRWVTQGVMSAMR